jgi:hypothetical protein
LSMRRLSGLAVAFILSILTPTAAPSAPHVPPIPQPAGMTPSLNPRPPYTIRGLLTLVTPNLSLAGSACAGQGGYADIQEGKVVTVTDTTGRVIGIGRLAPGHPAAPSDVAQNGGCDFAFEVAGVPEMDLYSIALEGRGTLQYSLTELRQQNWFVRLQLSAN